MGGVYLVKGGDPILRDREVARLLEELVGDEDRTLLVEEYTVPAKAGAAARVPTTTRPPRTSPGPDRS